VSAEYPPPAGDRGEPTPASQNIAKAIAEVSERATLLVREEIELAKAEVTEKASKLIRGAVVGVAAGIFFLAALVFVLVGCAWLLYYYLPIGGDFTYFWGFFAMAVILVALGVIAGLVAAKLVKKSSPPVPSMAIDEARKIREAVSPSPSPSPSPSLDPSPSSSPGPSPSPSPDAGSEPAPAESPPVDDDGEHDDPSALATENGED
jgi:hypothetical protein